LSISLLVHTDLICANLLRMFGRIISHPLQLVDQNLDCLTFETIYYFELSLKIGLSQFPDKFSQFFCLFTEKLYCFYRL